ncbi:hypothetical protein TWF970_003219 [Orbilia oligospora]|uniref:Uncharacterized protein n=1 Tax=Orbilia oligospora TaxID=2813651 RepID=A0A7C8RLG1_ORBOL|nr:hypothetical protein TWF970_003219 [Orbilia oligospora]
MSSQEEKLAFVVANETKLITNLSAGAINNVTKEIKSTIVPHYRWEELLMTVPVAINCLGGCFIASSSPIASTTTIPTFDYRKTEYAGQAPKIETSPENLQVALVECSNLGRHAFLEAERGMGQINTLGSRTITTNCQQVIECLNSPPNAKKYLSLRMSQLKKAADDCHETALLMDQRFEEWLVYTYKLQISSDEHQLTTEKQRQNNELDLKIQDIKEKAAQDHFCFTKQQSEKFNHQVEDAREDYRKAMDNFPNGWEGLLGDLASGYVNTMNTAINAITSVGADQGATGVQGLARQLATQSSIGQSLSEALVGSAGDTLTDIADPAYVQLNNIMVYLNIFKSVINGPDGGIDWAQASNDSNGNSIYLFAYQMLSSIQDTFRPSDPVGDASAKLVAVLHAITQVLKEIRDTATTADNLDKADPIVIKWQDEFNTQYNIAYELQAKGRKLPGNPINAMPVIGGLQQAALNTLNSIQKGGEKGVAQAMVDNARAKADAANAALREANDKLMESNKMLAEQKKAVTGVQASLTKLQTSKITLEEVKAMLVQSIALIVKMKAQIETLAKFFSVVSTAVDAVVKTVVEPFMQETAISLENFNEHYSLDDFMLTSIFHGVLTIRAYFSSFTDVAKMWITLSDKHIIPGLTIVEEIGVLSAGIDPKYGDTNTRREMNAKIDKLESWVSGAGAGIGNLAKATQEKIQSEMQSRVQEMAKTTSLLLPSPEEIKLIEEAKVQGRVPPVMIGMMTL